MRFAQWSGSIMLLFVAGMLVSSTGCGKGEKQGTEQAQAGTGSTTGKDSKTSDTQKTGKVDIAKSTDKHEGWWCKEHGIPEHLCSLCQDDVAAKCKKDGDWCKLHERAKSQCFKCDPSLYQKFEAMHVAKFNKKPEPPPKEEFQK